MAHGAPEMGILSRVNACPTNDSFRYGIERQFWRLREVFQIQDDIDIPAGDYTFTNHTLALRTSERRSAFANFSARFGGFYTGTLATLEVEPTVILGPYAQVGGSYQQSHVVLDEGAFTTHLWAGRVDVHFTPDLSWKNLAQYDSESKNLSVQTRLRWIIEPGRELFLVGLYGWEKADHDAPFVPTTQESAVKLLLTFRF